MSNKTVEQPTDIPRVDERFSIEVITKQVVEPKALPVEVLRMVVKAVIFEIHEIVETESPEATAIFESEFPVVTDELDHTELLRIFTKIQKIYNEFYDISKLIQKNYPVLYQVRTQNPHDPVVSFFSFSDEFLDKHVASAWLAASTSRNPNPYAVMFTELMNTLALKEKFAAKKIESFGIDYGHSSILELIPIFIFINNIPISSAYLIHHLIETYSSQELSTRYVELLNLYIKPISETLDLSIIPEECKEDREFIENEWLALQELAVANYIKWSEKIGKSYHEQFGDEVNGKPIKKDTHKARYLDVARNMIPIGAPTSMAVLSNLRTYISLLRQLRDTDIPELLQLADQIEYALRVGEQTEGKGANARIAPLLKHAEGTHLVKNNLSDLKDYLNEFPEFLEMLDDSRIDRTDFTEQIQVSILDNTDNIIITVIEYIKVLYPSLDEMKILKWLITLNGDQQAKVGALIFKDHDRHHPMGNMGNIKSDKIFIIKAALSELRDWNRQRASGKADVGFLLPIIHAKGPINFEDIINQGFIIPPQLYETESLTKHIKEWTEDANIYYTRLLNYYNFLRKRFPEENLNELTRLFLLGHMTTFHMSTPVTQFPYTSNLRDTPGNDFANRVIADKMIDLVTVSPFLRDVEFGYPQAPMDFNSPEQYNDRT